MSFGDELRAQVDQVFKTNWSLRAGRVVPDETSLTLSNDAIELEATILYADLARSTKLVDEKHWMFAAEIYKTFLYCSARIVNSEGGTITAYDGDRISAVYLGDFKNTSAVRSALKINYGAKNIIQAALQKQYPNSDYVINHTVGVDTSVVRVAKTGVRGANDLVWVGRAANWAAKLCDLGPDFPTWITMDVYNALPDNVRIGLDRNNMWQRTPWVEMNGTIVYKSTYWWQI